MKTEGISVLLQKITKPVCKGKNTSNYTPVLYKINSWQQGL